MKHLILASLILLSVTAEAQFRRYLSIPPSPNNTPSTYAAIPSSDLPDLSSLYVPITLTSNVTINGPYNFNIGGGMGSTITSFSAVAGSSGIFSYSGGYGFNANSTGIQITPSGSATTGALLYKNSSGYWVPVNPGTDGQVFTLSSGLPSWQNSSGGITGSGTTNQLTYWTGTSSIGALNTSTYPSLTELSYVKGVTSGIQTQIDNKQPLDAGLTTLSGLDVVGNSGKKIEVDGSGNYIASTQLTNPATTDYDMIYWLSGAYSRLAKGANGEFLTTQSGALSWAHSILLPNVTTGTGSSAGLNLQANNLTTGNGVEISSSSITTGKALSVAASGTAAASNSKAAIYGLSTGTNATTGQRTYGIVGENTSNGLSSTNIGVWAKATTGSTNYGLLVGPGSILQETTQGFATPITLQSVTNNSNEVFNLSSAGVPTFNLYNTSGTKIGDYIVSLAAGTDPAMILRNSGATTRYNLKHDLSDDAFLIFENTVANTKVLIGGDLTPSATLEVVGRGTTTGTAFKVGNSAQSTRFSIADDGTSGFQGPLVNFGNGTSAPSLRLLEPSGSGTNYTAFTVGAQSADITYTLPPAVPSSNGQALTATTGGVMNWSTVIGGSTGSTDNRLLRSDGTGGVTAQNSLIDVDDLGELTTPAPVNALNFRGKGNSAGPASLALYEDTDNGTNSVSFVAGASIATNMTHQWPSAVASSDGSLITTDTNGDIHFTFDKIGWGSNSGAATGYVGEEINSTVSTYTNYTTTATYQELTSITLTAGDWDVSAFFTYSSNSATITAASNAVFVISTTTASASGATEGLNISYVPQAALLGTSKFSDSIAPYRIGLAGTTTIYLNTQATFTVGNPQFVGTLRARRIR